MDVLTLAEEELWWIEFEHFPFAVYWVCPGCGHENDRTDEEWRVFVKCSACPARVPWPFPMNQPHGLAFEFDAPSQTFPIQCLVCSREAAVNQLGSFTYSHTLAAVTCGECYALLRDSVTTASPQQQRTEVASAPPSPKDCRTPNEDGGDEIFYRVVPVQATQTDLPVSRQLYFPPHR